MSTNASLFEEERALLVLCGPSKEYQADANCDAKWGEYRRIDTNDTLSSV